MATSLINDTHAPTDAAAITTPKFDPLPRPPWLPEGVWPLTTVAIGVDAAKVAVSSVGGGPVPLFVYTDLCPIIWRDVMSMLATDFGWVCLDAPGTGLSKRPPSSKIDLRRPTQAVTAVIRQLDLEVRPDRSRPGWTEWPRRCRRAPAARSRHCGGQHVRLASRRAPPSRDPGAHGQFSRTRV
jgi:hypothetical protein